MPRIKCPTPAEFSARLKDASRMVAEGNKLIVLFTGAINATTGKSWCGDCTRADPVIDAVLEEHKGVVLLECIVERGDYRDPQYEYRTNPKIQLACVPTLMTWSNPKVRLDDSQSSQIALVRELFEDEQL